MSDTRRYHLNQYTAIAGEWAGGKYHPLWRYKCRMCGFDHQWTAINLPAEMNFPRLETHETGCLTYTGPDAFAEGK